jgi:hypothetical protein
MLESSGSGLDCEDDTIRTVIDIDDEKLEAAKLALGTSSTVDRESCARRGSGEIGAPGGDAAAARRRCHTAELR